MSFEAIPSFAKPKAKPKKQSFSDSAEFEAIPSFAKPKAKPKEQSFSDSEVAERPTGPEYIRDFIQKEKAEYDWLALSEDEREITLREIASDVAKFVGIPDSLVEKLNKRLLITKKLGQGAMGSVYEAEHLLMGKDVSLKVFLPKSEKPETNERLRMRFIREVETLARLNHPNVAKIYGAHDTLEGALYFGELVMGESLGEYRKRLGDSAMEIRTRGNNLGLIDIMKQSVRGVAAMHEAGVIHRDLKPDNIMLARENDGGVPESRVKIIDFGLSRDLRADEAMSISEEAQVMPGDPMDFEKTNSPTISKIGSQIGTSYYMAPEQIRGEKADERSDVYGLGVTFYELATGRRPIEGMTVAELQANVLNSAYKAPKEWRKRFPEELNDLILRMMSLDPDDRPTLSEVLKVIEDFEAPKRAAA